MIDNERIGDLLIAAPLVLLCGVSIPAVVIASTSNKTKDNSCKTWLLVQGILGLISSVLGILVMGPRWLRLLPHYRLLDIFALFIMFGYPLMLVSTLGWNIYGSYLVASKKSCKDNSQLYQMSLAANAGTYIAVAVALWFAFRQFGPCLGCAGDHNH